jgi:hypothetical protein
VLAGVVVPWLAGAALGVEPSILLLGVCLEEMPFAVGEYGVDYPDGGFGKHTPKQCYVRAKAMPEIVHVLGGASSIINLLIAEEPLRSKLGAAMFRGTNFTESNESYRSVEGEMGIADRLWKHFEAKGYRTREERSRAAYDFACEIYESKVGPMPGPVPTLSTQEQGIWMMDGIVSDFYAEWAEHAFPRVQMSHSFAAMLMATKVSPSELDDFEAPWPAFVIEIPDGLLPIQAKGVNSCITRVGVNTNFMPTQSPERWWTFWMQGPRIELHRGGTIADIVAADKRPERGALIHITLPNRPDPVTAPIEDYESFWEGYSDDQEERVTTLVTRLIVGVCVMMTERANFTERVAKSKGKASGESDKRPESRVYTLGKPVKIDFRQAVRAFVEGRTKGPLTVQALVAGHHKRQPYGPNSSLRKWIFIEPYWKGDLDDPVIVRPHVGGSGVAR